MNDAAEPIRISHTDDGERSRATVFFRIILLIPHLIWFTIWSLGAILILPLHWIVALARGRSMGWAHRFYAAFVRYSLSLYAYWYLATDRYPPFQGESDYVVHVDIPEPQPQRRWTIALRLFLALPALILASALSNGLGPVGGSEGGSGDETSLSMNIGVGVVIAFLAWFASLALRRTPQGLRDAQVYCLGYAAQAYSYFFLLTDRYPTSDPRAVELEPMPDHPIELRSEGDALRRDRLVVAFRLLLAIPHFVWLTIWSIGAFIIVVFGWFAALFTGRLPQAWRSFLASYVRYATHVMSFLYVFGGPFPGFLGRPGTYPVELDVAPQERQSRWKTGFRLFLAVPALMLASGFSTVTGVAGVGAWFAALFTGRVPQGLHRLLGWTIRYQAQFYGYVLLLTDRYPYTGPDGTGRTTAPAAEAPDADRGPETWDLSQPESA